jgi:hypothetical protein
MNRKEQASPRRIPNLMAIGVMNRLSKPSGPINATLKGYLPSDVIPGQERMEKYPTLNANSTVFKTIRTDHVRRLVHDASRPYRAA